ncbi:putative nucleic acid binding protein [Tripterygium wilfordii]|uniref:Putative nucleic acid binding protein n=2 Tax=Tripterygium wilfordii TaxID=458696 RepID=A0A7J7CE80_TRIWF|nr:nuclear speckle RNA-binding protein A-like isoform X1 [Tripterygium wilfordii]KAF5732448.1 putative nucleic acid binding protein [Tripterygium wilfordii]
MADAYWRYNDARQHQQPPTPQSIPTLVGKRPRTDYDVPSGHELPNYYPRNDDRGALSRDTEAIGASYDRYLRSTPVQSYGGGHSARLISGGVAGRPIDDRRKMGVEPIDRGLTVKDRSLGFGRSEVSLPPDASSTLFVEGLPSNCTQREVSHIFRPFVGYKEVRLVNKESRHHGGEPLVLCFVDFLSPAHAATAMDALQGYKFDEHDHDHDSVHLRLQFARYPGARSGGGHRGKR